MATLCAKCGNKIGLFDRQWTGIAGVAYCDTCWKKLVQVEDFASEKDEEAVLNAVKTGSVCAICKISDTDLRPLSGMLKCCSACTNQFQGGKGKAFMYNLADRTVNCDISLIESYKRYFFRLHSNSTTGSLDGTSPTVTGIEAVAPEKASSPQPEANEYLEYLHSALESSLITQREFDQKAGQILRA